MKSWNVNYPGVISSAVCLVLLMTFATGCSYRSGDMYSDWRGVNTNRYVITDEDIQAIIANTRPSPGNLQAHFRQGLIFQARGQHKLAIDEFNRVLMIDPSHTKAHNAIGVSLDNVGYYEAAVRHYHTALSLDPGLDYVYNNLGYSYFLQGNYTAAIESFQKAVELNQDKMIYHNNLGMAYAQKGLFDEALTQFEHHPLTSPIARAEKTVTETEPALNNQLETHRTRISIESQPAIETETEFILSAQTEITADKVPEITQIHPATAQDLNDPVITQAQTQVETPRQEPVIFYPVIQTRPARLLTPEPETAPHESFEVAEVTQAAEPEMQDQVQISNLALAEPPTRLLTPEPEKAPHESFEVAEVTQAAEPEMQDQVQISNLALAEPPTENPVTSQPEIIAKKDLVLITDSEQIAEPTIEIAQVEPASEPSNDGPVEISAQARIEPVKQENVISRQEPVIKPGPILDEPAPMLTNLKKQEQTAEPVKSKDSSKLQIAGQEEQTHYTVQVGAFQSPENAAKFHARLTEKGYSSFVNGPSDDHQFHRVQVGSYPTLENAQTAARSMSRVENIETFASLLNHPPMKAAAAPTPFKKINTPLSDAYDFLQYVPLEVLNGNGVRRMAAGVQYYLETNGFKVRRIGDANHFNHIRTTIYFRPGYHLAANLLAEQFDQACEMRQVDTKALPKAGIRLIIGKDMAPDNDMLQQALRGGEFRVARN